MFTIEAGNQTRAIYTGYLEGESSEVITAIGHEAADAARLHHTYPSLHLAWGDK